MTYIPIVIVLMYYLIFMLYYRKQFPTPNNKGIQIFLSLLIVFAAHVFLNTQTLRVFRIPIVTTSIILGIYFSTTMNWRQAIIGGSFCVLTAYCSRGIFISICWFVFQGWDTYLQTNEYYGLTMLVLPFAFLFYLTLRRAIFSDDKVKRFLNNSGQLKLIIVYEIIATINLMNINLGRDLFDIWYSESSLTPHGIWGLKVSIGSFVLTLVMLLYTVYQSIQNTELLEYRFRVQTLETQYEQQLRHYKSYQKYTESFRVFKHDYKAMMVSLKALLRAQENERAIQLLDELYNDMQKRVEVHKTYSDNVILDAMLQDAANICKEKQIRFLFNVFVPHNTHLSKMDAIRIFSNITKNAIEACEKLPVSQRFLNIVTKKDDQWFTLEVVNSYDGTLLISKGNLMTTKAEEGHGLGIGIIEDITQKLGGFVIYDSDTKRKTFLIRVHIPRVNDIDLSTESK